MSAQSVPPRLYKVLPAIGLLAWRLLTKPPSLLWRDWVTLVAVYWIYVELRSNSPEWGVITTTVMAYLMGIQIFGQLPHVLSVLGIL